MRLADMNLTIPCPTRRIEIVCNGLPVWHGNQLAVDTYCIGRVNCSGEARGLAVNPASPFNKQRGESVATPTPS